MINKRQYQKTNDKKFLHKIGKQWKVVSIALLLALGGSAAVTTTATNASANSNTDNVNAQENTVTKKPKYKISKRAVTKLSKALSKKNKAKKNRKNKKNTTKATAKINPVTKSKPVQNNKNSNKNIIIKTKFKKHSKASKQANIVSEELSNHRQGKQKVVRVPQAHRHHQNYKHNEDKDFRQMSRHELHHNKAYLTYAELTHHFGLTHKQARHYLHSAQEIEAKHEDEGKRHLQASIHKINKKSKVEMAKHDKEHKVHNPFKVDEHHDHAKYLHHHVDAHRHHRHHIRHHHSHKLPEFRNDSTGTKYSKKFPKFRNDATSSKHHKLPGFRNDATSSKHQKLPQFRNDVTGTHHGYTLGMGAKNDGENDIDSLANKLQHVANEENTKYSLATKASAATISSTMAKTDSSIATKDSLSDKAAHRSYNPASESTQADAMKALGNLDTGSSVSEVSGDALQSLPSSYSFVNNKNYGFVQDDNENYWKPSRSNKHPITHIDFANGNTEVNFSKPIYFHYLQTVHPKNGRHGDPQKSIMMPNGQMLVLYNVNHGIGTQDQIVKYNMNRVRHNAAPVTQIGPVFNGGHGQGMAYDSSKNQLWLNDTPSGSSNPVTLSLINLKTLRPEKTVQFKFGPNDTSFFGDLMSFDNKGNLYTGVRTFSGKAPKGSFKLFKGTLGKKNGFKMVQGLKYAPGSIIQNMAFNPNTNRLYLVSNSAIESFPVNKIGHLQPSDVHEATFKHHIEFEDLAFRGNKTYLLLDAPSRVMQSSDNF